MYKWIMDITCVVSCFA